MSPPSPTTFDGAKGSLSYQRLRPGHLLFALSGRDEGDLGRYITSVMETEIKAVGSVVTFIDGRGSSGSAGPARELAMEWFKAHREYVRACHVLFDSRLAAMAVAVVNLVTGGFLTTYSDVATFEAAIRSEVPGFSRLPPPPAGRARSAR